MMKILGGAPSGLAPFAPPFLEAGKLRIAQTANILAWLAPRHGLVPSDEASRLAAHQHQLTIMDLVFEVHETHHPVDTGLYYEDQKPEAKRRAKGFTAARIPKFLDYFERVIAQGGGKFPVKRRFTYVDLSLFQIVEGLRYAFPNRMRLFERQIPALVALRDRIAIRPNIKAYLASHRRIAFNEDGIFRHYKALDD